MGDSNFRKRFAKNQPDPVEAQRHIQAFLNTPVKELVGLDDVQTAIAEVEYESDPRSVSTEGGFVHYENAQDIKLNPENLTVRQYLSLLAYTELHDPFVLEETRQQAHESHGELYQRQMIEADASTSRSLKLPEPGFMFHNMFTSLTAIADHQKPEETNLNPKILRNGMAVIRKISEQEMDDADYLINMSDSARAMEKDDAMIQASSVIFLANTGLLLKDDIPSALLQHHSYEEICQKAQDFEKRVEKGNKSARAERNAYVEELAAAISATVPVDYETHQKDLKNTARPFDATRRINDQIFGQMETLTEQLGISQNVRRSA